LKKGLGSPGKVLEFHLHQRVDTLNKTREYGVENIYFRAKKKKCGLCGFPVSLGVFPLKGKSLWKIEI
jgi:ribosomal protein L37E